MAETIKFDILSLSSIKEAQKQLINYKNSLRGKCDLLVERLSEIGLSVIESKVNESPLGIYVTINAVSELIPNGSKMVLVAKGKVFEDLMNSYGEKYKPFSTVLAIEFGAGISYNPKPNPNAEEYGYGVGTYNPEGVNAYKDGWYFWNNKTKTLDYTKGIKATMPMFEAESILDKIKFVVAREVFK